VSEFNDKSLVAAIDQGISKYGCYVLEDAKRLRLLYGATASAESRKRWLALFARQHGWTVKTGDHSRVAVFRPNATRFDTVR